ncbi:MAG: zinc-binding dehydrogenase [Alphaproteobacteria bacterium]|nr:zinc-binding dehydrogenase [Alphaproteobacteria bacterium]MCY4230146.1 zinc-binding dehydrogenase [Alphaproteobacteria bacterium]MCY4320594.1 zinc-binding dehydrogenase [Alphaproteobacteria bacterium]
MRALVLEGHGGQDCLAFRSDWPEPEPGPGEVVIRVRACSLNYHDVFTRRGMPGIKVPLPVVPGLDLAGEVEVLGAGVEGWSLGDRVLIDPIWPERGLMGEMLDGGLAEKALCSAGQLVPIPEGVSFAQAAALPVAYGTAHRMMFENGHVKAGETVLILGASGGVGNACVLLAKAVGAHVIAAASSQAKIDRLLALGADEGLNYTETQFEREIWRRYGKPFRRSYEGGVDVVVNFTGGDTWVPSMKALKRGGRMLTCGATASFDPKTDIRYIWTFELQILGSNSWTVDGLTEMMADIAAGHLAPPIDVELRLEDAAEGVRMLEDREVFGKIVVTP